MKAVKYLLYCIVAGIILWITYQHSPSMSDIITYLPAIDQTTVQRIQLVSSDTSQISSNTVLESNKTCTKKRTNFLFVKTHKTGTSTTVNILYHFGIIHGLNYAVYPYSHQLHLIRPERLMRLASNETYNIMCQHMVFDKRAVESVMPHDSYYFSLIRSPLKAFVSFYIFYNNDHRMQTDAGSPITLDESINRFLDLKYEESNREEKMGSYLIANNLNSMSYDLGMSQGSTMIITDDTINNYIKMLDDRFDLLMTLEHLDESLLLLQHDLCWEPHDIYYLNRMVSKSNRSHEILSDSTKVRLTQVLTPDVKLYNHFSAKLLKRLDNMPPEFKDKLVKFKEAKSKFESDCMIMDRLVPAPYHSQQHPLTEKGQSSLHCQVLADKDVGLTKFISRLQDPDHASRPKTESYGYISRYQNLETYPRQWKLQL